MRAVARWCLPVLLLAAMFCAHSLTTTAEARLSLDTIAVDDAALPDNTSSAAAALSAEPPAQIPFWCLGPGVVVVMSITKDAHSPSRFTGGPCGSSAVSRAPAPSIVGVHPTPSGHATPLLI